MSKWTDFMDRFAYWPESPPEQGSAETVKELTALEERSDDEILALLAFFPENERLPFYDLFAETRFQAVDWWLLGLVRLLASEVYALKYPDGKLEPHVPYLDAD